MKARVEYSGNTKWRNGRRPHVAIAIEPETPEEEVILRMAYSSKSEVYIWESGRAEIQINMPVGSNDVEVREQ
jgi:mannose-6-phosphate isomerase-like protein (cupin superfamily)